MTVGYESPVITEDQLSALSQTDTPTVMRTHVFSNGEKFTYVTHGDKYVNGDIVLGTRDEIEKIISDYQNQLNKGISSQAAMTNRCTARLWFGGCIGVWEGVRWPRGTDGYTTIWYEPLNLGDTYGNLYVRQAMDEITAASNGKLIFKVDSSRTQQNRIYFTESSTTEGGGCWSRLGWQAAPQQINLQRATPNSTTCQTKGIALHEIGHAIGLMHEHSRPERDQFITVNFNNLTDYGDYLFGKWWYEDLAAEYSAYDYCSVMHYRAGNYSSDILMSGTAFSTNQANVVCYFNNGSIVKQIGDHYALTSLDKQVILQRYGQ